MPLNSMFSELIRIRLESSTCIFIIVVMQMLFIKNVPFLLNCISHCPKWQALLLLSINSWSESKIWIAVILNLFYLIFLRNPWTRRKFLILGPSELMDSWLSFFFNSLQKKEGVQCFCCCCFLANFFLWYISFIDFREKRVGKKRQKHQ